MTICIALLDRGYGPSIEDWRALRDQTLSDQGARFGLGPSDSKRRWFGDVRDALVFNDGSVGCYVHLTFADIEPPLCRLLFELAERARLFVTVDVGDEILRPPSLRGVDLDWGPMRIAGVDSAEALFQYFQPQDEGD